MQRSPGAGLASMPAARAPPISSKHTILPPTCHPPSMLDFEMDGQKKSICSEAYLLYAGIWKECTGGKVSIPGDEVLYILSASTMSDVSLYILSSASRISFANPDGDYVNDKLKGTSVSWRMLIVLLSLAHQLSGLDLDTFLSQVRRTSSSLSPTASPHDLPSGGSTKSITGKSFMSPSTPRSPASVYDTREENLTDKNQSQERIPRESPKPSKSSDENKFINSHVDPAGPIADGFQEYTNYFAITPQAALPPLTSDQSGGECRILPFRLKEAEDIPTPGPDRDNRLPRQDKAGFPNEKYPVLSEQNIGHNILSFDEGLIPVLSNSPDPGNVPRKTLDYSELQVAQLDSYRTLTRMPSESSAGASEDPVLHVDHVSRDPRTAPIVRDIPEHSELELIGSVSDSRSDPIPLHSLEREAEGLILDDDWPSIEPSATFISGATKTPSMIFEAESPDITTESMRIARDRLEALQNGEPLSKQSEKRNIFGRKKSSTPPQYSLSILATALETAVREGSLPLVATFLELGADPNYRSRTPQVRHEALQCAAARGFSYMVDYLIHKGADQTAINEALIYGILRGHVDLAMKLVSTHNADVNTFKYLQVKHRGTLKFVAGKVCANALAVAAFINNKKDRIRLVNFLLARRCEIDNIVWFFFKTAENVDFGFGYSNLALFIPKCPETVKILLAAGIPAQTVRKEASIEIVNDIRRAGFSCDNLSIVQAISRIQSTSWELRCSECLEVASLLIRNGADVDHPEIDGIEGHMGELGWKMTPMARAVKGGSIEGVNGLINLGASPNSTVAFDDAQGHTRSRTILHYAVQQGNIGIVQALISCGAMVNKPSNIYGVQTYQAPETALGRAASLGYLEIVRQLLDAGAHSNDGSLHRAARNGHIEVVKLLLRCGAEIGLIVDGVSWPTQTENNTKLLKENPDVNRLRRPRGNVICFAMSWNGAGRKTTKEEDDNYAKMIHILFNAMDAQNLVIDQAVLRAALDANNVVGLKQLLNIHFMYKHPATDMSLPIYYVSSRYRYLPKQTPKLHTIAYGFTPIQYAMMMHCDNTIIDLLASKGASKIRVIYSSDEMDTLLVAGTKLIWETCRSSGPVPKRVDGLEGAKEYVTHYRFGGEWRPTHIHKIKI